MRNGREETAERRCRYLGSMAGTDCDAAGQGRILGVFHHGWYLECRGTLWLLHDDRDGKVPFGIGVRGFAETLPYRKEWEGRCVLWERNRLHLPGMTLLLPQAEPLQALRTADVEEMEPVCAMAEKLLLEKGRGELRCLLRERPLRSEEEGPAGGESLFLTHARHRLRAVWQAWKSCDERALSQSIERLLGLGGGLTPSMDDWTVGFFYTALRLRINSGMASAIRGAADAVPPAAQERTNRISAAYVTAAVRGSEFEALSQAFHASGPEDLEPLLRIGGSSGCDMLTGMVFAMRWGMETEAEDRVIL